MTFCELFGVIEICALPICAIPTTGIVARGNRSAAHVQNNFLMVEWPFLVLSKPTQARSSSAFPILPILCLILFARLFLCTRTDCRRYSCERGEKARCQGEPEAVC